MFHSTRVASSRDAASAPSWGRTAAYCLRAAIERAVPAHAVETIIQLRATQLRSDHARLIAVFAEIALAGPPHRVAAARHLIELARNPRPTASSARSRSSTAEPHIDLIAHFPTIV